MVAETPALNLNEYRCAHCEGVFRHGFSDEDGPAEISNGVSKDACYEVVCHDCYRKAEG